MKVQQKTSKSIWPWIGWFVASTVGLYQFLLQTSTSVMIPDLEKVFSINSFGVSLLSSSFFYTYLLCQIPAGMIIDYFRARWTIFICQLVIAFLCVIFAQSTHWWSAGVSRSLMGLFAAPSIVSALYLAARSLPERYFSLVAGLTEAMGMLGGVAGEALLARSITQFGWQTTMLMLAATAVTMATLAILLIRDDTSKEAVIHQAQPTEQHFFRDFLALLKMPQAWINGLICGFLFGLVAAFGSFWCIPFLMKCYGISVTKAADASSMIFIGVALGAPFLGWLSDKLATKRRIMMMVCSAIALILSLIIIYAPVSLAQMFWLILFLGFFAGVYMLPYAVIRDITPSHIRGAAMGYINMMCILIGAPILQPLIGWLLHQHATLTCEAYHQALSVLPLSVAAAMILSWFVKERN